MGSLGSIVLITDNDPFDQIIYDTPDIVLTGIRVTLVQFANQPGVK